MDEKDGESSVVREMTFGESIERGEERADKVFWAQSGGLGGGPRDALHGSLAEPVDSPFDARGVYSFHDAVGVSNDDIPSAETHRGRLVGRIEKEAEREVRDFERIGSSGAAKDERRVMAGVGVAQDAGGRIKDSIEQGSEMAGEGSRVQLGIDGAEDGGGILARKEGCSPKRGLDIGDHEGGGKALAGGVADGESQPVSGKGQEVVAVAAEGAELAAASGVTDALGREDGVMHEALLDVAGVYPVLTDIDDGFGHFLVPL